MKGRVVVGFIVSAVLAAVMADAQATHPDESDSSDFVQKADLIFEGTVVNVEYRSSDVASRGQVTLPHTFVTYLLDRNFKGKSAEENTVTLRFRGGADEQGNTLMIPGAPLFEAGDHDIVFVRGNGTDIVPLVGGVHGRFRVFDNGIYSDSWQELWLSEHGKFDHGKLYPAKAIVTHRIGSNDFSFETTEDQTWTPPRGSQRATAPLFRTYLSNVVGRHFTPQALSALPTSKSVDIREDFYVLAPRPVAAPSVPAVDGLVSTQAVDPLQDE